MFNNKKATSNTPTLAETIIGKGTMITGGTLTGMASVRIDGEFFGDVDIEGDLILGESGKIEGNVKSRNAMVAGRSKSGRVVCTESLHIVSSGAVYGDIQVGSLIVDEHAIFIGNCKMMREGGDANSALYNYEEDGRFGVSYNTYEDEYRS